MTISTVVTRGFGSFGNIGFVSRAGYASATGTPDAPPVVTPTVTVIGDGDFISWKDELEARHRKKELERLIARTKREVVKLKKEEEKTEKKIEAEKRQSKPVDGILARYLEISFKLEEKKTQIRGFEQEFRQVTDFLGDLSRRITDGEDDEDDIEVLLLS